MQFNLRGPKFVKGRAFPTLAQDAQPVEFRRQGRAVLDAKVRQGEEGYSCRPIRKIGCTSQVHSYEGADTSAFSTLGASVDAIQL